MIDKFISNYQGSGRPGNQGQEELEDVLSRDQLESLGIRELITEAEVRLKDFLGNKVWTVDPLVCHGSSDRQAIDRSVSNLIDLELVLGRKLVGAAAPGADNALYQSIGLNAINGYYAAELQEHQQIIAWYRSGEWKELHRAGYVSEDEYHVLREEFPDGNPCL